MTKNATKTDLQTKADRRQFLKDSVVIGGVITTGIASSESLAESYDEEQTSTQTQSGYRETAHIREYYRLARS